MNENTTSTSAQYNEIYEELRLIGRGTYGKIFFERSFMRLIVGTAHLVKNKVDGHLYVAKKINLGSNPKEVQAARSEGLLLKNLRHPHIVSYKESYFDKSLMIIIMEYCEGGDLTNYIRQRKEQNKYFSERIVLNWFVQTVLAVDYIHKNKILHRDIKPNNIFLTANGTVKLGDFGISKLLEGTTDAASTFVGTANYMSPEVCESRPYNYKSDIWSLGCLLYELCTFKV